MLFQYFIFTLELIFFVALITYLCFLWRGRHNSSFREKTVLLLPAVIAVLLLLSGIKDSAFMNAVPAVDILGSLLLMILLRSYALSGRKFFAVLSYFMILICVLVIIFRFCMSVPDLGLEVSGLIVFYPLLIGCIMFLMVVLSKKAFSRTKTIKTYNFPKAEELFSYVLSVTSFFFILTVSVCIGVQSDSIRIIFSVVPVLLAILLYFWQFNGYIMEFKRLCVSHSSASAVPPPSLIDAGQTEKGDAAKELYSRIVDLFDTSKPYLVDGITVSEVARMLFTNKVYVSRAINDCTGKNFCQFVNYYRVMYAVRLFNGNPYLKVSDLSDMSGFHNQVSFNMAFRLIMHETPSDWCRRQRLEREG